MLKRLCLMKLSMTMLMVGASCDLMAAGISVNAVSEKAVEDNLLKHLNSIREVRKDYSLSEKIVSRRITNIYEASDIKLIRGDASRDLDSGIFHLAFKLAFNTYFYTYAWKSATDLARIYRVLSMRSEATNSEASDFYGVLLSSRQFNEALRFREGHRELTLDFLPKPVDANLWRGIMHSEGEKIWVLNKEGDGIYPKSVLLDDGDKIVVVSSPACHFCRDAVADIHRDPVLRALFKAHSIWIVGQDLQLYARAIAAWNQAYPEAPMYLVNRQSDWEGYEFVATPVFYFTRHGKIFAKVVGWAKGHRSVEFNAAIKEILK